MLHNALKDYSQKRNSEVVNNSFWSFLGTGVSTRNGNSVNNAQALTLSAFYNGINILCNDYAKLPKSVIQVVEGDRKKRSDHAIHYIISQRPNQLMTAFMFDSMMLQYAVLKGNAYAEIIRDEFTGYPKALMLIDQQKHPVTVKKSDGKLFYHFDGKVVASEDMIHVPGFSFNGITGVSVVTHAARSLGVNLSTQEYASDYYTSRGAGLAVVETKKDLTNDAKTRYASAISSSINNNSGNKAMVIDDGNKFHYVSLTAQEAAFLQTHKLGIPEVARWLNIPPHKLKDTENTNYSNMESQNISHVNDSISPWKIKFNQEYNVKLFSKTDRENGYKVFYNMESLLQADKKTQAMWFSTLVGWGVMTREEAREKLDLPYIAGLDAPLTPVNTQTLEQLKKQLEDESK